MKNEEHLSALLNLLQDEDARIASLAMEEFLRLGEDADRMIARYQESGDPRLRQRIHQLSSILSRRRARRSFLDSIIEADLSLWEGIVAINCLYDPRCNTDLLQARLKEICSEIAGRVTTPRIAALMREKGFCVPEEHALDTELFMIASVFKTQYGNSGLLCVLAREIAQQADWPMTVVMRSGRFCLIDENDLLLDPSEAWNISCLEKPDQIHPCSRKDMILAILCQVFLVALVEGQLRELHHFGDLLTALNSTDLEALPYPLGNAEQVESKLEDNRE